MLNRASESLRCRKQDTRKLWDFPTRAFHWTLAFLFGWEWFTGKTGGTWMTYHMWGGYAVLTLIIFRLLWGFVGSSTARFAAFLRSPREIGLYIRGLVSGTNSHAYGHNPLGGLMVVAFLLSLSVQVGTGLFATDDILTAGPLNRLVGNRTADLLTLIHKDNFDILLSLVALHILAIALHLVVGRKNLVGPMITGRIRLSGSGGHQEAFFVRTIHAATGLIAAALLTWLIVQI